MRLKKHAMRQRGRFSNGANYEIVLDTIRKCLTPTTNTQFNKVFRDNHNINAVEDMRKLEKDMHKTKKAFLKSELVTTDKQDCFFKTLLDTVSRNYQTTHELILPTSWFLLRSVMVDVYGISRLLTVGWDVAKVHERLTTRLCANVSRPTKAIVYLGDTHVQIWRDILLQCTDFKQTFEQDEYKRGTFLNHKIIHIPKHIRKPLIWEMNTLLFNTIMDMQPADRYAQLASLTNRTLRHFFQPWLLSHPSLDIPPDLPRNLAICVDNVKRIRV